MASDVAQHKVTRNKEGIPCWDGDATSFQEYEELSLAWEQSVPVQKRYLAGPKLANELTGVARRFITGKRPDWLSYDGGVAVLMEHLRKNLGLPQLPEMTSFLNQYFRNSRRKRSETMNGYITRKLEILVSSSEIILSFEAGITQFERCGMGVASSRVVARICPGMVFATGFWLRYQREEHGDCRSRRRLLAPPRGPGATQPVGR